jgi:hypothetical protein
MKKALKEEWERINPEYTNRLVESIPDHLKEATINRGLQTILKESGGMRD